MSPDALILAAFVIGILVGAFLVGLRDGHHAQMAALHFSDVCRALMGLRDDLRSLRNRLGNEPEIRNTFHLAKPDEKAPS